MMNRILAEGIDNQTLANALRVRRTERKALLERLTLVLETDPRVAAAWLFGSVARNEEDDLSDLDLRVIIYDEHIAEICTNRHAFAAQVGEMVLAQEAPQNRPAGGAFLLALYAGEFGPQEVDWTWEPLSTACLWPKIQILTNRSSLRRMGEMPWGYQSRPNQTAHEEAVERVCGFWAMLLIVAKYAARSPDDAEMALIGMAVERLREICDFLGITPKFVMDDLPSQQRPEEKFHLLCALADEMERVMASIEAMGAQVPWSVLPYARQLMELMARLACSQVR